MPLPLPLREEEAEIEKIAARDLGPSPKVRALAIRELSDLFLSKEKRVTPWSNAKLRAAYLLHHHVRNRFRAELVARRGEQVGFWNGLSHIIDVGSGTGAASLGLRRTVPSLEKLILADIDLDIAAIARIFQPSAPAWDLRKLRSQITTLPTSQTCALHSFTLNEGTEPLLDGVEAVAFIEPGTRDGGHALQTLRQRLIDKGWWIYAPCTHQQTCPFLLNDSDWCHDRVPSFESPPWEAELKPWLPIDSRSLAFSYLLARRTSPGIETSEPENGNRVRIVGDLLAEKGRSHVRICRSSSAEKWIWHPQRWKKMTPPTPQRGELWQWTPPPIVGEPITAPVTQEHKLSETIPVPEKMD